MSWFGPYHYNDREPPSQFGSENCSRCWSAKFPLPSPSPLQIFPECCPRRQEFYEFFKFQQEDGFQNCFMMGEKMPIIMNVLTIFF